jgi:uncharacterized protein YdhG (YjbR/CyaY superfamily)
MQTSPKYKFTSVDEYIATFSPAVKEKLEQIRAVIKRAAPNAQEVISYNMPAYKQHGVLVYFAAAKAHIGFYPTGSPIVVFKKELEAYKTSKGAIQFPISGPIPTVLVADIVTYRAQEDLEKAARKKKK